jgi:hypothetical protein
MVFGEWLFKKKSETILHFVWCHFFPIRNVIYYEKHRVKKTENGHPYLYLAYL